MEFDLPRGLILLQEVILLGLYLSAAYSAWRRRKRTQEIHLRAFYMGIIWIAVGVIGHGLAKMLIVIYFWGDPANIRLVLWEIGMIGFFVGAYFLLRYDYESFEHFYQTKAVEDFENSVDRRVSNVDRRANDTTRIPDQRVRKSDRRAGG